MVIFIFGACTIVQVNHYFSIFRSKSCIFVEGLRIINWMWGKCSWIPIKIKIFCSRC